MINHEFYGNCARRRKAAQERRNRISSPPPAVLLPRVLIFVCAPGGLQSASRPSFSKAIWNSCEAYLLLGLWRLSARLDRD